MCKIFGTLTLTVLLITGCSVRESTVGEHLFENVVNGQVLDFVPLPSHRIGRGQSVNRETLHNRTFENNIDRMGSDFTHFSLNGADPQLCQQACDNNNRCVAWTYVRPNTMQGSEPICWLKDRIPNATINNSCVSGVK